MNGENEEIRIKILWKENSGLQEIRDVEFCYSNLLLLHKYC